MALIPRKRTNLIDPFDSIDYWDCLRRWRALDFFDTMVPSFFQPLYATRIASPPLRSKSMSNLSFSHEIITASEGFRAQLDVHRFKPHEVEVRIVDDVIVVEGKQEEQWDNSRTTTKSFAHRYSLPIGYDPWQVSATLSSSGILTITCPPPARRSIKCLKRYVPIKHI